MVFHLSVGEVAALLNVAIVVVQLTYPMLLSFICVGFLTNRINAASWSVFGRLINSSLWPLVLRTDVSSGRKVLKRFRWMSHSGTGAAILLAFAAAITPLGLHTATILSSPEHVTFTYFRDPSPIGQATSPRLGYKADRLCGNQYLPTNCPGNNNGFNITDFHNTTINVSPEPGYKGRPYVSTVIAQNISSILNRSPDDGLSDTVAGFFDIEYRSFINWANRTWLNYSALEGIWVDKGAPRTQGGFGYFQQFLLNNRIEAVEGLIVSTADTPGVGFRNHTLPPKSEHGYVWEEEILWLEPETACTDLNVTLDYTLPRLNPLDSATNVRLTDRGGIVGYVSNVTVPPDFSFNMTPSNARLWERAWAGAALTNNFLKHFLNATNATLAIGDQYPVETLGNSLYCNSLTSPDPNSLTSTGFGWVDFDSDTWAPNLPGFLQSCTEPFFDGSGEQTQLGDLVANTLSLDPQTPAKLGLGVGLISGIGVPVDGKGRILQLSERNTGAKTQWSQRYFSCATAVKASIKQVRFEMKGEPSLSNVQITVSDSPNRTVAWAVEDTQWPIADLGNPLWGPIAKSKEVHGMIAKLEQDHIYVPAGMSSLTLSPGYLPSDAVAGSSVPLSAIATLYYSDAAAGLGYFQATPGLTMSPDYTGTRSWPMLQEWARLTQNASTASRALDLIVVDLLANALVGTRSVLHDSESTTAIRPATKYVSTVAYNWKYATLALLFAALYILLSAISVLMYLTRQCSLSSLRFYLNLTSSGRSTTMERFHGRDDVDFANTQEWASIRGDEWIRISKEEVEATSVRLLAKS